MPPADSPRLPFATLIAYALPAVPPAMLAVPLVLYLPAFYAADMGLGFAAAGSALFAVRLAGIAGDAVAGWAGDRVQTAAWGRRRPWLVAAALVVVPAVWSLAHPPRDASVLYLGAVALLVYVAWSTTTIAHLAWGAELVTDYHERSRLMAARGFAVLAGVALSAALPNFAPLPVVGGLSEAALALRHVAWAVALALPLAVAVALWRVPEPPPAGVGPGAGWRLMAANRPLRRLLVSHFCATAATALPAALLLLFVTYVVVLPEYLGGILLAYLVGGLAGAPLWVIYARRQGKHRAWCLALLFSCVTFAAVPLLGRGDLMAFLAVSAAAGVAFAADLVLPAAILGDVVDADTAAGGGPRTGLHFGLLGAVGSLAVAAALGLAVPLLDLIGFGAAPAGPAAGLYGLAALFAVPAVAFKFIAIAALWSFPLDATKHAALRRHIERRAGGPRA